MAEKNTSHIPPQADDNSLTTMINNQPSNQTSSQFMDHSVDSLFLDSNAPTPSNYIPEIPSLYSFNNPAETSNSQKNGPIITSPTASSISTPGSLPPLNPERSQLALYADDHFADSYTLSDYNKLTNNKNSGIRPTIVNTSADNIKANKIQKLNSNIKKSNMVESINSNLNIKAATFKKPKTKKLTSSNMPPKRPAFVIKLWNMVNDPSNTKYICWMPKGDAFQVLDRENFMKFVLPKYFKHNNFASFVRQLNMYGWHKIQDINSGSLVVGEEIWQFENPNFIENREDLLDNIIRNKSTKEDDEELDIKYLMDQLEIMKSNQRLIADDLRRVRQDNEMLWKENFLARERHKAQSDTLDKILRFLASVYGNNTSKLLESMNDGVSNDMLDFVSKQYNNDTSHNAQQLEPHKQYGYYDKNNDMVKSQNQPPQQYNRKTLMITNKAHDPNTSSVDNSQSSSKSDLGSSSNIQNFNSGTDFGDTSLKDSPIQDISRGPENRNTEDFQHSLVQSPSDFVNTSRNFSSLQPTLDRPLQENQDFSNSRISQIHDYNPSVSQEPQPISPEIYYPDQSTQEQLYNPNMLVSSRPLTPVSEVLMGNINSQLNRHQGTLKQANEWINKFATRGDEGLDSGIPLPTDDFKVDDFLQQPLDSGAATPMALSGDGFISSQTPVLGTPTQSDSQIQNESLDGRPRNDIYNNNMRNKSSNNDLNNGHVSKKRRQA